MRRRSLFYGFSSVILLGLLIFFNASPPVRFVQGGIFSVAGYVVHPLNVFRLWKDGAYSPDAEAGDREEKLAVAVASLEELTHENDRLRAALGFKDRNKVALRGVRVLYYGRELGKEYMMVDRGDSDNIAKGSVVIDANGVLLGTVDDVQDAFAKVSIASNAEQVFDAELLPSGVKAFAKGLGARGFSLELLPQDAVIRMGDFVMMKGSAGMYLLGEVVRVETSGTGAFKEVRAVLLSHPEWEEEVFIVSTK
ncbi:MAG: rod shape-determining protein MreC [bacterium]|nr:rod shape-determining protein MreC [bacterium]MDZ4285977.1 rod shape-determining protein MreC [Candidatus Sungbacteria bacterium]